MNFDPCFLNITYLSDPFSQSGTHMWQQCALLTRTSSTALPSSPGCSLLSMFQVEKQKGLIHYVMGATSYIEMVVFNPSRLTTTEYSVNTWFNYIVQQTFTILPLSVLLYCFMISLHVTVWKTHTSSKMMSWQDIQHVQAQRPVWMSVN